MAAVLVGSMSSAIDSILPRNSYFSAHDGTRHLRGLSTSTSSALPFLSIFSDKHRRTTTGRYLLRSGEVGSNFDGLDEDNGNGGVEEEEWEVEMRRRLGELEEMKELEKRAEELQTRLADEENEEGEEESRSTRARKVGERAGGEEADGDSNVRVRAEDVRKRNVWKSD